MLQLLNAGHIAVQFDLRAEMPTVAVLLSRYQSVSVSLADAELVQMAELYPNSCIFTLDSDFHSYRKNRDQFISLISPQL